MRIVITGGAGFLGQRLAWAIHEAEGLTDTEGNRKAISRLLLIDTVSPAAPPPSAEVAIGDITDRDFLKSLFAPHPDSVFHLAAVVSAAAEADFDLGMHVNVDGTRAIIDVCRTCAQPPRFVFASSIAAFGLAPPVIADDTLPTPQTSYGTQKVMSELLIDDCSRKGFIDGRALRLPTIVVRPGRPNKAASSFASSILREPLAGESAICPVPPEQKLWILSPRRVTDALLHGHALPAAAFGARRTLNLPGLTVSVAEMVDALGRAGGDPGLVQWRPDPAIAHIVAGWPAAMAPRRAQELGFTADASIDEIVRAHIADSQAHG